MNYYSLVLCFIISVFHANAQEIVTISEFEVHKTDKSKIVSVTLSFEILDGYHIQSEIENLDDFIATEIRFEDSDAFNIESYEFTSKQNETVVLNEYVQEVLMNSFDVTIRLKIYEKALNDNHALRGELYYQACTNRQCLFPRTLNIQIPNI